LERRRFLTSSLAASALTLAKKALGHSFETSPASRQHSYAFHRTISREMLDNYLSRAISMEGLLNGRGNLTDNIRMLASVGAKYIGRSICLWGGEANLLMSA
jgi:hypothetical protein